jgi:hypothetical protein
MSPMCHGVSILDFTTGLFRDPVNLRSFVDDPQQALRDAGLGDATPAQVHDLLPVVAESMPPDHPLQEVVHSADLVGALRALDVEDLVADAHDHHREVQLIQKAVGGPDALSVHARDVECLPQTEGFDHVVEAIATWEPVTEVDKALGDAPDDPPEPQVEPAPQVGEDSAGPADHYCDHSPDLPPHELSGDHAIAEGFADTI